MKKRSFITLVLALALVCPLCNAFASEVQWPVLDETDQEIRLLIVADPQDTARPQPAMLKLLNAALDEAQPHLVIFLGDMIHGPSTSGYSETRAAIDAIIQPVVERQLPFALVFGNHDNQGGVSNEEQLAIYQTYPGCLAVQGEEMPGCGNYYLLIGNPAVPESPFVLWFLDSGTYAPPGHGTYGYVTEEQNVWMLETDAMLRESYENPAYYVFQHIPVPQVFELLREVPLGTKGAVTPLGPGFMKWYQPDESRIWSGHFGEGPCASEYDSGEFNTWKTMGVRAAFFGHDHMNDYCGTLDGIDLIATSGIGFYLYGRGDEHGARLVTLNAENPHNYETKMLYYRDLVDDPLPALFISSLGTLIQRYLLIATGALLLIILFIIFTVRQIKKRKIKHVDI